MPPAIPPLAELAPAGSKSGTARLLPLDVLRILACVLVLGNHMPAPPTELQYYVRKLMRLWQHTGWIGVDLFFVLSGFLVAGLLLCEYHRHGRMQIGRFLIRRGLKIYPALYFLVAFTVAVRLCIGPPMELHNILGELLFLQNYWGALWGHTWSLAVEEHFYLSLPVVLLLLSATARNRVDPFTRLPQLFVLVAVLLLALRIRMNLLYEYAPGSHMLVTHLRTDSLLFGVLLSYFYHFHRASFEHFGRRFAWPATGLGLAVLVPILLLPHEAFMVSTIGVLLLYLTGGMLLTALLVFPFPHNRFMRFCGYLGTHSYSIYLWHYPCVRWGVPALQRLALDYLGAELPWHVITPMYMAASIVLGVVMARLIEFPVLAVRDRFFPALSQPVGEVARLRTGATLPGPAA